LCMKDSLHPLPQTARVFACGLGEGHTVSVRTLILLNFYVRTIEVIFERPTHPCAL
jgi:hypothetical protein